MVHLDEQVAAWQEDRGDERLEELGQRQVEILLGVLSGHALVVPAEQLGDLDECQLLPRVVPHMHVEHAVILIGDRENVAIRRLLDQVHLKIVALELVSVHLRVRLQLVLVQLAEAVLALLVVAEECDAVLGVVGDDHRHDIQLLRIDEAALRQIVKQLALVSKLLEAVQLALEDVRAVFLFGILLFGSTSATGRSLGLLLQQALFQIILLIH